MNRMTFHSRISADGVLRLTVPVGSAEADRDVQITIEPMHEPASLAEWDAFVRATAGAWQGDFERPPVALPETRDPLP